MFKWYNVFSKDEVPLKFGGFICKHSSMLCNIIMRAFCDGNTDTLDNERLAVFFGHYPAGSNIYQWIHIDTCLAAGEFRDHDHGPAKNM